MSKRSRALLLLVLAWLLASCGADGGVGSSGSSGSSGHRALTPAVTPSPTIGVAAPISITGHSGAASPTPRSRATPTVRATQAASQQPTAGPSGPYGPAPALTAQEKQLVQQLFALINSDRAREGLPSYTLNSTLSTGAYLHSWNMAHCGLSHACPGEPAPCQRVSNEGISWSVCGENVGYASATPDAWSGVQLIEQSMLNEQPPDDGHRRNLLSSDFRRIGLGIYLDTQGYVWVTEDFAN